MLFLCNHFLVLQDFFLFVWPISLRGLPELIDTIYKNFGVILMKVEIRARRKKLIK